MIRKRRGFALIDALVGGIMLSIGLGVVLTVGSRALAVHTRGEKRVVASWLADELLSMVVIEGPMAYPLLHDVAGNFDEPFEEYWFEVEIEDRGIGEPFGVAATVGWQDAVSGVRVETLIAQRQGDPIELRMPAEWVDRETRYLEYDDK